MDTQHPTALGFLDETGSISSDRFFAVGFLKLTNPAELTRAIQKLRDRTHWHKEIHFTDLTQKALPFYKQVVDVIAAIPDCSYSCFVADSRAADPIKRFGSPWLAYQKLAQQLIIGSVKPRELVAVLADNYSTPAHVLFEEEVKYEVNRRMGRLAVTTVCRQDSKSADPLQLVDLLTGAVAFEFRESAGLAVAKSVKGQLAAYVREQFGVDTALKGVRKPNFTVEIYGGRRSRRSRRILELSKPVRGKPHQEGEPPG